MALVSPGVQVSVIDESFYTPAEPGTVPMIFVASAQDKVNSSGTGTAQGTTAANAGKVYLMTSQRELAETFGDPIFKTDANNNPINGGETNEYGLQAAYSYLGVANQAFVVRADVDLNQLEATASAPAADPNSGTYWFDTASTLFGVFEWNGAALSTTGGQSFTNKTPIRITDSAQISGGAPKGSVGAIGDYAINATDTSNGLWYKKSDGLWVSVGSPDWQASRPTIAGGSTVAQTVAGATGQTIDIKIGAGSPTTINHTGTTIASLAQDITGAGVTGLTAKDNNGSLEIYYDGSASEFIQIAEGSSGTPMDVSAVLNINAGTNNAGKNYWVPTVAITPHTSIGINPAFKLTDSEPRPTGSIWVKTTDPNLGAKWRVKRFNGTTKLWETIDSPLYSGNVDAIYNLDRLGGGQNLSIGDLYVNTNNGTEATSFVIFRRENVGNTVITSEAVAAQLLGQKSFNMSETLSNSNSFDSARTITETYTGVDNDDAERLANAINSAGFTNIEASVDSLFRVQIAHKLGGEIQIVDTDSVFTDIGFQANDNGTGTPNLYGEPGSSNPLELRASNWRVLSYTASADAPTALATDGQLWYSSVVDEVDLMIHNGSTWVGYLDSTAPYYQASAGDQTDPAGPIVSASEPTEQSDGTPLKEGDIWISTADLENYPTIYKRLNNNWVVVDKTDQTTENGILFADARAGTSGGTTSTAPSGTIAELLASNHLDTDAPDPALYPKGMLLWNLRRSGFNVKKFNRNYVDTTAENIRLGNVSMQGYYPHRWATESANQPDGSGSFGRKAQRKVIVQSLQAMVNSNQDIRDDESRIFNLMATPSYPELIGEMISLNNDRGLSAFIVGDSPFRLTPDATSLNDWAKNVNLAVEDNDNGLVSTDEYLGVFYPSGFTSDNFGNNVVVPPSHMMLRTIALSDQVSFPWFAPAGTRRGGITNASSTGYINSEGEFVATALNEGQRDTLYSSNVNPITFITGAGLVNYGQKTRFAGSSSLDRINVARLVIYLRSQLNKLARPYVFEPNDKITRDEIKAQAESLLLELVGNRAIYDFLVVCDESNNTPTRIDRNELYLDIAIEPVKAVEFIYVPLRLKNTGEIAGL